MGIRSPVAGETGGPPGCRSLYAMLVAAPPLLLCAGALLLLLAAAAGIHPLWPRSTLSLPEAAYLGDRAAVARMLLRGHDANQGTIVRAGLIGDAAVRITPLEAAVSGALVRGGQIEIVKTLLVLGARAEGETGRKAACLALAAKDRQVVRLLRGQGVPIDRDWCQERGLI